MADALWRKSAIELAGLIKDKSVSSVEVVESHLERINDVNPYLNAVTVILADSAMDMARKADNSQPAGRLHGVPFSVKENIDCLGSATTQGVPAMVGAMPTRDAVVVQRMKAAGAIPISRTNLPEFALRISTANPLHGRTMNPWHAERVAGGSSGGEASSIASGMSPIGLGNDIGGSLRNPAYCCGIASLKPTTGRIPSDSSLPPEDGGLSAQMMNVQGPMARHVADVKLGYEILSGRHYRDPVSVDVPLYGDPPTSKSLAIVTAIPGVTLPEATVSAINQAAEILMSSGYQIEEICPPELPLINELWGQLLSKDIAALLPQVDGVLSDEATGMLKDVLDIYQPNNPENHSAMAVLHAERSRLRRLWSEFFLKYPAIVGPVWTQLPFFHDDDVVPRQGARLTIDCLQFITPGNLLGIPAAVVPTGISDGLPTSVQIYADMWREDICLELAGLIEQRVGQICPIDPVR
jgi:amidase